MGTAVVTLPNGKKARITFETREQLDAAVNDLTAQQSQPAQTTPQAAPQQPRTFSDSVREFLRGGARQLGLGARDLVNAAASPFALATDSVLQTSNALFGTQFTPASQALNEGLSSAGLPEPASDVERYTSAVNRAVASGGGSIALGSKLAQGTGTAARVGESLAARPGTQLVAGATGATTAEVAKDAGVGPTGQAVAGVAGGLAGAGAFELTKAGGRALQAMAQPFSEKGQRQIVADTLADAATSPGSARRNLENAAEIVPGSPVTTGPGSRDLGLLSLERRMRNKAPDEFAEVTSTQNTARQDYLTRGAKTPEVLEKAIQRRDDVTKPLRDAAFKQAEGKQIDSAALVKKIDDLLEKPENAGGRTQQALNWAKDQITGKTDPRALYAIRKEVSDAIAGKVESEKSFLRYTSKELSAVRGYIDEAIEGVSGNVWKKYLEKYSMLSKPIERMRTLQDTQEAVVTAPIDVSGQRFISQAKWFQKVTREMPELEKTLTKGQVSRLKAIGRDLDRGELINSKAVRPLGSDTANNLTVANLIGAVRGHRGQSGPLAETFGAAFGKLSKASERQIQALLIDSLKDPKLAASLLAKATPNNVKSVADRLRELGTATAVGTASGQTSQRE